MTIEQFLAQFESWDSKERGQIALVVPLLSSVSKATLLNFQRDWVGSRPYSEFVTAQNKKIRMCIELEVSQVGYDIRKAMNIPPLTLTTEIGG